MKKYGIWIESLQTWVKETYVRNERTKKYQPVYSLFATLDEANAAADEIDWEPVNLKRKSWKKMNRYVGKKFTGDDCGSPIQKYTKKRRQRIEESTNLENLEPGFSQKNFDENMKRSAK